MKNLQNNIRAIGHRATVFVLAAMFNLLIASSAIAATFIVTTTADSGPGSLRAAIIAANSTAGADVIEFDISALFGPGPHTITLSTELPPITEAVTIDGYTETGASAGVLKIILSGASTPASTAGFTISGGHTTIQGLVINEFSGPGIYMFSGVGNKVLGNFIGTDVSGTLALGNAEGILIASSANIIGGTTAAERNLISGNDQNGVSIVLNSASGNMIIGNYIGTDVNGTANLGNGTNGVNIDGGALTNIIGGTSAGEGNRIAFNVEIGVFVQSGTGNAILGNSIFNNGALGIDHAPAGANLPDLGDIDTGPNNLQNYPLLTSAETGGGSITITGLFGSTPSTSGFRLEFFANTICNGDQNGNPHPFLDYGEGETFLGFTTVSTDGSGGASFSVTLSATVPAGAFITATATAPDPDNSTSEFSRCVETVAVQSFVLLANHEVEVYGMKDSQGDVHANQDVKFYKGGKETLTGNLTAVQNVKIEKKNTIDGDVTAGLEVDNDGIVTGTITEYGTVNVVPMPVIASFTPGIDDFEVHKKGSLSLSPGNYGQVDVGEKATLNLTSGTYNLKELHLDQKSELVINIVNDDPVIINLSEEIEFNDKAEMSINNGTSADVVINSLYTHTIYFKDKSLVLGTINVPFGRVELGKKSVFKGAIAAEDIHVLKDAAFFSHSYTGSLPKIVPDEEGEDILAGIPTDYELSQNYPNPFNPTTIIQFALPEAGRVSLKVYDIRGQLVKSLVNDNFEAGYHQLQWDATNDAGLKVSSGYYFYRLQGKNSQQVKKMLLMK